MRSPKSPGESEDSFPVMNTWPPGVVFEIESSNRSRHSIEQVAPRYPGP